MTRQRHLCKYFVLFLCLLATFASGQHKRESWQDRVKSLLRAYNEGQTKELAGKLDKEIISGKDSPLNLCSYATTVRWWQRLVESGLITPGPGTDREALAEKRLQEAIRKSPKEAYPYLCLYWHETTFESDRTDKPSKVEYVIDRDGSGKVILDSNGQPRRVKTEYYGADPAKLQRLQKLFEKARALAPNDREVLYIEGLHEKDPAKKYAQFLRSYSAGGDEVFGLGFLDKLAAAATAAGNADDSMHWAKLLQDKLDKDPRSVGTRLYLAAKARRRSTSPAAKP